MLPFCWLLNPYRLTLYSIKTDSSIRYVKNLIIEAKDSDWKVATEHDFKVWETKVRKFLAEAFGDKSDEVREFQGFFFGYSEIDENWEPVNMFSTGIDDALAFLEAQQIHLERFGEQETPHEPNLLRRFCGWLSTSVYKHAKEFIFGVSITVVGALVVAFVGIGDGEDENKSVGSEPAMRILPVVPDNDNVGYQGTIDTPMGQKLTPVTPEVIHKQEEQKTERKLRGQVAQDSSSAVADRAERAQQLLQLQQKYLVMSNAKSGQSTRIALTLVESGSDFGWTSIDQGAQDIVSGSLTKEGFGVTSGHFRKPFFADGKLEELVSGNGEILARLRPDEIADIFLVGTVTSSISESKQLKETKTCKLRIAATAYDPSGRMIAKDVFSVTELGFDDVTVRENAIKKTVPKVLEMLKAIE